MKEKDVPFLLMNAQLLTYGLVASEMLLQWFSECANLKQLAMNNELSTAEGAELQLANVVVVNIGPEESGMDELVNEEGDYFNSCSCLGGEG